MTITLNEIRNTYLNFFEKNGHKKIQSSPLVPDNDPTLMFTNAGMVQFKNIFTGAQKTDFKRATTAQKCVRAGGKHNDLDNVGYTVRHHTFFEMMGNFSFGDYFKEDAIKFAWDLLTKDFCMPKNKLLATVYHTDDEAYKLWKKIAGFSDDQIIRIPTKDNFWQMGDTGPCGPCSEVFYDHGEKIWGGKPGTPEEDGDRFIEIWNLVFMQFEDLANGERVNLKAPSIDTGLGLERFTAVLQNVHSNYEIDLFQKLIKKIADTANSDPEGPLKASHNVVADHLRSASFLIADGVLPSNEGRGYVLRRIMRRAMRHLNMLGIKDPVLHKIFPTLQQEMGEAYPELYRAEDLIKETLKLEETRFIKTMEKGLSLLDDETKGLKKGDTFNGKTAFKLYDTYGFPLDLTQDALRSKDISVDTDAFNKAMEKQKAEARKNWAGSGDAGTEKVWFELRDKFGVTDFLGYQTLRAECQILHIEKSQNSDELFIISNQTPFYGESGGQVGDIGKIIGENFEMEVTDVKKKLDGLFVHICKPIKGEAKPNTSAMFIVNEDNRSQIRSHHSVTHLIHRALRDILGKHVTQKGSLVAADKMRFDVSHPKQITKEELERAEIIVNEAVRRDYIVKTTLMTPDEAINKGAMALFGEKYGEEVRVVSMEKDGDVFSTELCGGTHVNSTGEIGYFNITSESAVAAGIRRIECVTGKYAERFVQDIESKLNRIGNLLKASPNDIENRIEKLIEEKKKLEDELLQVKKNFVANKAADNKEKIEKVNGISFVGKILNNITAKELKIFVDEIKQTLTSGIIVLAAANEGKASIVVGITNDLTKKYSAVELVKIGADAVGGQGGGGRPDLAQAGGPDGDKINLAIEAIKKMI